MEMGDLRGLGSLFCILGFLVVVWWAYGSRRKEYFESAAEIPFLEENQVKTNE